MWPQDPSDLFRSIAGFYKNKAFQRSHQQKQKKGQAESQSDGENWHQKLSLRCPRQTYFLEFMPWNEPERKYRFSITEMKKNFHELNLVIWISSYNPQELLITNTTLFHIVEQERAFVFLSTLYFIIISSYKYCWKITVFYSFYLENDFFCV